MKILGKVIAGKGEGRSLLGFPTANISITNIKKLPSGVFLAETLYNGRKYKSLAIIGASDNFEVWLVDFDGDLYSETLEITVGEKISDIEHFASSQELINKIKQDVNKAKKIWEIN